MGDPTSGNADIEAAKSMKADVAEKWAAYYGITP